MKTFIILAVIIFVPFVWFITNALRYTDRTVGNNSPFSRTITVRWPATRFFKRAELIFAYILMSLGMLMILIAMSIIARQPNEIRGFLFVFLIGLATVGIGVYAFEIQARLWKLVQHRRITFEPITRQIIIEEKGRCVTLTASEVVQIERHRNVKNYKAPIVGFDTFVLTSGNRYSIHDLFLPVDVIDYYFPGVPQTVIPRNQAWFAPEDDTPITELCPVESGGRAGVE